MFRADEDQSAEFKFTEAEVDTFQTLPSAATPPKAHAFACGAAGYLRRDREAPGKTLSLPCVSTAFAAKTLSLPCVSTAFAAKTLLLPCVSTADIQLEGGLRAGATGHPVGEPVGLARSAEDKAPQDQLHRAAGKTLSLPCVFHCFRG